jgi:hypothetical protein
MSDSESYDDYDYDDEAEPVRVLTEDEASSAAEEVRQAFARYPPPYRPSSASLPSSSAVNGTASATSVSDGWPKPLMTRIDIIRIADPESGGQQRSDTACSDEVFFLPGRPRSSLADAMSQSRDSGFYKVSSDAEGPALSIADQQASSRRLFEVTDHDMTRKTYYFRPDTTLNFDESNRPPSFRTSVESPLNKSTTIPSYHNGLATELPREAANSIESGIHTPRTSEGQGRRPTVIKVDSHNLSDVDSESDDNDGDVDRPRDNDGDGGHGDGDINNNSDSDHLSDILGHTPDKLKTSYPNSQFIFPEIATRTNNDLPKMELADKGQSLPLLLPAAGDRKPFNASNRDAAMIDSTRTPSEFSAGILNDPIFPSNGLTRANHPDELTFGPLPDEFLKPRSASARPSGAGDDGKSYREFWTQTIGQMLMKAASRNSETQTPAKFQPLQPVSNTFTQTPDPEKSVRVQLEDAPARGHLGRSTSGTIRTPSERGSDVVQSDPGRKEIMRLLLSQVRSIKKNLDPNLDPKVNNGGQQKKRSKKQRRRANEPPVNGDSTAEEGPRAMYSRRMELMGKRGEQRKPRDRKSADKALDDKQQPNTERRQIKSKPHTTKPMNGFDGQGQPLGGQGQLESDATENQFQPTPSVRSQVSNPPADWYGNGPPSVNGGYYPPLGNSYQGTYYPEAPAQNYLPNDNFNPQVPYYPQPTPPPFSNYPAAQPQPMPAANNPWSSPIGQNVPQQQPINNQPMFVVPVIQTNPTSGLIPFLIMNNGGGGRVNSPANESDRSSRSSRRRGHKNQYKLRCIAEGPTSALGRAIAAANDMHQLSAHMKRAAIC